MTAPPATTPKIALAGVVKSFGSNHVLKGVDLVVPKGSSTVIIGGSGTGKSVTLKCVLGLVIPDQGTVHVDGADITRASPSRRGPVLDRLGMLFQGGALFDSLTVWQNVAFRRLQGRDRLTNADARDLAVQKLRRVGLTADVADRFPAELSGGMQKRVGLARAIAT
ncbi:MAG: ATP-binding cassette domain-containing protein, partial [Pseudomonadota bacterium]